jgi:hypothetical protein
MWVLFIPCKGGDARGLVPVLREKCARRLHVSSGSPPRPSTLLNQLKRKERKTEMKGRKRSEKERELRKEKK